MSKATLDEFFERPNSAAKNFKEELDGACVVMLSDDLTDEEIDAFKRVLLILIRSMLQDYGDSF